MEIKPNKPVFIEPQQLQNLKGIRPPGVASPFVASSIVDAVEEFSFNKLLKQADAALAGGNPASAREQYAKILAYEPENVQALYGKTLAEGLQSPEKLGETVGKLDQLLQNASGADRTALLARAGGDIVVLGKKAEADALAQFLKDLTPANHELFAERMEQTLVLYHTTAQLLPGDEGIHMAMIAASQRLMVPYRDGKSGQKLPTSEGIYEKGKKWLKKARDLLKSRFPNAFKRLRLYKKYQTCFVATAAWGDQLADEVIELRAFRDLYLRNNPVGRCLIVYYYRHGATFASLIAGCDILRKMARGMLTPVVWGIRQLPGMAERKRQME